MSETLAELLERHVDAGTAPGVVALLGCDSPELVAVGVSEVDGSPMRGMRSSGSNP